MAGLDRPTPGDMFAQGRNLSELNPLELACYRGRAVGMLFQFLTLLPRMTLAENVELPLQLAEVERRERAERVRETLERVHLGKRLSHRPLELSGRRATASSVGASAGESSFYSFGGWTDGQSRPVPRRPGMPVEDSVLDLDDKAPSCVFATVIASNKCVA